MFEPGKIFGSNESGDDGNEHGASDYDGRPLREYHGTVNGRQVTVYSSWRPGDPDR
jgi:hypothetical protein